METLGNQGTPDEATAPRLDDHILPLTGRKAEPYPEDSNPEAPKRELKGTHGIYRPDKAVDRSFGVTEQPHADSTGDSMPEPARPMQRWID